jgi:hypothetical protein
MRVLLLLATLALAASTMHIHFDVDRTCKLGYLASELELKSSKLDAGVTKPLRRVDGTDMTEDQIKGYLQGRGCDLLCEKSNFASNVMFWKGSAGCVRKWDELEDKEYVAERSDSMKEKISPAPQYKINFDVNADSIAAPVITALRVLCAATGLGSVGIVAIALAMLFK